MFKPTIIIPLAGEGRRFKEVGYLDAKPFISWNNKVMIQHVVESLNIDGNYVFLVRSEHIKKFEHCMHKTLSNYEIIPVEKLTEGAACTVLLAAKYMNEKPLIIANSDQLVLWNSSQFLGYARNYEGCIPVFKSTDQKWSYAKVQDGFVYKVAEKKPISNWATVGIYYWNRGYYFTEYAKAMIEAKEKVNNEYYVCPVYNWAITDGKLITSYPVRRMIGLGTPEDLEAYLDEIILTSR